MTELRMYKRILVPLDVTACDRTIIDHVEALAKFCGSSVILVHVADGWAARHFGKDAVSEEVTGDKAYLEKVRDEFTAAGIAATAQLLYGDPKTEILKWVYENGCDLIAMGTHGHRFLGELFLGVTASHVQHRVNIPVLLIRQRKERGKAAKK
jgi:nucleotide-binding universal stress UspA family protein